MRNLYAILCAALLLASGPLRAEVAVLVHGYLGSAASWETSGVNAALEAHGWQRAGVLLAGPAGVSLLPPPVAPRQNPVYAVELPSIAPLLIQADQLQALLDWVAARHPGEGVHLVAHSAGGVVARLVLARNGGPAVTRLVTIASPHLGTLRALEALAETHQGGPLGWFKDFFGGGLYHTVKGLLWRPAGPHPRHPRQPAVLAQPAALSGDPVSRRGAQRPGGPGGRTGAGVQPGPQQRPSLRGQAEVIVTPAGHALNPADGELLAGILKA
jgi:triacylglycerol lipase